MSLRSQTDWLLNDALIPRERGCSTATASQESCTDENHRVNHFHLVLCPYDNHQDVWSRSVGSLERSTDLGVLRRTMAGYRWWALVVKDGQVRLYEVGSWWGSFCISYSETYGAQRIVNSNLVSIWTLSSLQIVKNWQKLKINYFVFI